MGKDSAGCGPCLHDEQISEHGGIRGVRDLAVIDSALTKPHKLLPYGKPDAAALAAAYAFGLCNRHGFVDGNKRTGRNILNLNRRTMEASDEEVVNTMLAVASGGIPETRLAEWFRSFIAEQKETGAG